MSDAAKHDAAFLLTPEYENFEPGKTPLRFESLTGPNPWRIALLLVLFYVPLMLVFVGLLTGMLVTDFAFQRYGQATTATVTACEMVNYGKTGRAPQVTYSYVANGNPYGEIQTLPDTSGSCDFYPDGKSLAILYLSHQPGQSRIIERGAAPENWQMVSYPLLVALIVLVSFFSCGSLAVIYRQVRAWRAYPLLRKQGILLEGELVRISGSTSPKTGEHRVTVTYQFMVPRKRILTGTMEARRDDLKNQALPLPGTPVTILYADHHAHMML